MSIHRIGQCGGRGGSKNVYRYTTGDKNRMGNCDWLPSDGDLCIRVENAGDYFHNYVAVRQLEDGAFKRVGSFGAYIFGEVLTTLEDRVFHLACAGEPVTISL